MPVSFTFLFLHSSISVTSYFSLLVYFWHSLCQTTSLRERSNKRGVLLSQYFFSTWNPEIGCLTDEVISAAALSLREADVCLQCLPCSDFGVFVSKTESVLVTPTCFHWLTASRISWFPAQRAWSKKNTLDEFQIKVWQLFHFKPRLQGEENKEMNITSSNLITTTHSF